MCTILAASGFQIEDSDGSSCGAELKVPQEEIEAVDRAIEDEKRLALALDRAAQCRRPIKPEIVKGT